MPGTHTPSQSPVQALVRPQPRKRYVVARQEDVWFIMFAGQEFGPYKTEREAKLFAIDAAFRLGEQGEETEVLVTDEAGAVVPVWIYGQHAYPPRE
ncbi:MAG TPA: hypothetical protein VIY51_29405 [Xanthobacteraceae bacterium]